MKGRFRVDWSHYYLTQTLCNLPQYAMIFLAPFLFITPATYSSDTTEEAIIVSSTRTDGQNPKDHLTSEDVNVLYAHDQVVEFVDKWRLSRITLWEKEFTLPSATRRHYQRLQQSGFEIINALNTDGNGLTDVKLKEKYVELLKCRRRSLQNDKGAIEATLFELLFSFVDGGILLLLSSELRSLNISNSRKLVLATAYLGISCVYHFLGHTNRESYRRSQRFIKTALLDALAIEQTILERQKLRKDLYRIFIQAHHHLGLLNHGAIYADHTKASYIISHYKEHLNYPFLTWQNTQRQILATVPSEDISNTLHGILDSQSSNGVLIVIMGAHQGTPYNTYKITHWQGRYQVFLPSLGRVEFLGFSSTEDVLAFLTDLALIHNSEQVSLFL